MRERGEDTDRVKKGSRGEIERRYGQSENDYEREKGSKGERGEDTDRVKKTVREKEGLGEGGG